MISDLQNWCSEAKRDGTSSRPWNQLRQVYLVPGMTEDKLRSDLQSMTLNNQLTITYETDAKGDSSEEEKVILCGR